MKSVVALCGNISSGKTTLALKLARAFGGVHISSDSIRAELKEAGLPSKGQNVFSTMDSLMHQYTEQDRMVILDSTGMSPRYLNLLKQVYESKECFFCFDSTDL